jgi:hypothetical protein
MSEHTPAVRNLPILLPVIGLKDAQSLLPLAESLLNAGAGHVVLVGLVGIKEGQPLSKGASRARRRRRDLSTLVELRPDLPLKADPHVRVTYDLPGELVSLVEAHRCGVVIARMSSTNQYTLGVPVDDLLPRMDHPVILQRSSLPPTPERIVLSSRGGAQAVHAIWIAAALSDLLGGEISVLRATVAPGGTGLTPRQDDETYFDLLRSLPFTYEHSVRGALVDLVEALQREMRRQRIMVLGTTSRGKERGTMGPRTRAILEAVEGPSIVVHVPVESTAPIVRPEPPTLSLRVDKWFAENTFDADEFNDVARLVALKEAQGFTVSLGLPALNEEKTVGEVITTIRDTLMYEHPLLDEIVLIDSMSTDRTVEIAESLGIPIYRHPEILPEMGSHAGKGEALWKSLHVLKGDIIAWIDTDIANIHPRFVYGLIGPLLVSLEVQYVKGFYRRPLRVGDKLQAGGGGRVTELVARPMFNLFFPELSGILQPLSGEYAGRRDVLERVPFFSGYAVETGLLIDILAEHGLSAIAQVDLKRRIHHNQPLVALSKMSYVIIQAIFERLDEHQIINLLNEPSRSMKLIGDDEGRLFLDIEELYNVERPPMATVPAYRARREALRGEAGGGGFQHHPAEWAMKGDG